jgi:hypothetical protein
MPSSGSYTFTVSRDDIIREAMLNIGKIGDTEGPTPTENTDCARKLNMLVKQWMGRMDFAPGLKMWTRYRGDLFLSSTKGVYTLSPTGDNWAVGVAAPLNPNTPNYNQAPLTVAAAINATVLTIGTTAIAGVTVGDFVVVQLATGDTFSGVVQSTNPGAGTLTLVSGISAAANSGAFLWNYTTKGQPVLELQAATLRDSQQNDTPIDYMTLQSYEALPTKVQPGYVSDPASVYLEPQLTGSTLRSALLYLDVAGAQDVTKCIHIVGLRAVQDFVNPTDNPDFPQEWFLPLSFGLAKLICPMFNAMWTKELEDNYQTALTLAKQTTTPETTEIYFQPYAGQQ